MIRLFTANETNFEHNGKVLTDAKVTITEDVDGIFDLELEYPLNDKKELSSFIIKGNIIKSNIYEWDTRGEQLFEIRKVNYTVKKGEKKVIAYAQAIGRSRLGKNFILGCRTPAGSTRKVALQTILSKCVEPHTFIVGNLDTNTNTNINLGLDETTGAVINYLDTDYMSPLKAFLGEIKSVQSAYGGEIIYNNFEINMIDERGSDYSFIIKSGKNLQELQQELSDLDNENFATALIMKSSDGIYLPNNEIIYSSNVASLGKYYKVITCDDVQAVDDSPAAIDIVYAQLRDRAAKQFANGIDKLPINNTINFLQLANTEEYKNYASLEKCSIGNNVTVNYEKANIEATGRVTQIKFNPIANNGKGKITEVTIGDRKKQTIINAITNADNAATELNEKHNTNKVKIKKAKADSIAYTDNRESSIRTSFKVEDDRIEGHVINVDEREDAHFSMLQDSIELSVKKAEFGAFIKIHYNEVVQAIVDATGTHTCTFNGDGLTVQNGGFKIKNNSGQTVLTLNGDGVVAVQDIEVINKSSDSWFYNNIMNMTKCFIQDLGCGKLVMSGTDFYLTKGGESGYDLTDYIVEVLKDYNLV